MKISPVWKTVLIVLSIPILLLAGWLFLRWIVFDQQYTSPSVVQAATTDLDPVNLKSRLRFRVMPDIHQAQVSTDRVDLGTLIGGSEGTDNQIVSDDTIWASTAGPGAPVDFGIHLKNTDLTARGAVVFGTALPGCSVVSFNSYLPAAPTISADPVIGQVWAGLGGHRMTASGAYFPVICRVEARNSAFTGRLVASNGTASWSKPVSLSAGDRRMVEVDVRAGLMNGDDPMLIAVELRAADDHLAARQTVQMDALPTAPAPEQGLFQIAAYRPWDGAADARVGEHISSVIACVNPPGVQKRSILDAVRVGLISPLRVPDSVNGWDSARTVMVGAREWNALSEAARAALKGWALKGGTLLAPRGVLEEMWGPQSGQANVKGWPSTVHSADLRNAALYDAAVRAAAQDTPLKAQFHHWGSITPAALAQEPGLQMPRWPVFVALALAYALIFGPFSLWLMRRVRRILMVWLVAPCMAAGLTAAILLFSATVNQRLSVLTGSTIAVVHSGVTTGETETNLIFFCSRAGTYQIDAGSFRLLQVDSTTAEQTAGTRDVEDLDTGSGHRLLLADLPDYSQRHIVLVGSFSLDGSIIVARTPDGGVRLENRTGTPLEPGIVTVGRAWRMSPLLSPGETVILPPTGKPGWVVLPSLMATMAQRQGTTPGPASMYTGSATPQGSATSAEATAMYSPDSSQPTPALRQPGGVGRPAGSADAAAQLILHPIAMQNITDFVNLSNRLRYLAPIDNTSWAALPADQPANGDRHRLLLVFANEIPNAPWGDTPLSLAAGTE